VHRKLHPGIVFYLVIIYYIADQNNRRILFGKLR